MSKATFNANGAFVQIGTVTSADPASINAGAVGTVALTIAGAKTTDLVFLNPRALANGLVMAKATVSGANTVTVSLLNTSAGSVNDVATDYDYVLVKTA
jgi:energy-converting hydrogenase Eha subunit B